MRIKINKRIHICADNPNTHGNAEGDNFQSTDVQVILTGAERAVDVADDGDGDVSYEGTTGNSVQDE